MSNKKTSFSDKMVNLTNDRTVTTDPGFLEMLAPIMSILFFSGAGDEMGKLLGLGGDKAGMLPSGNMMKNQAAVQGSAKDIASYIRGAGSGSTALGTTALTAGGGQLTPEMIIKLLTMIPGII